MILPIWDIAWIVLGFCALVVVVAIFAPPRFLLSRSERARRRELRAQRRRKLPRGRHRG